ncbi:glutaminase family protein [Paenibacillus protaetiae]|uniref:DUF4965 domain-containing protein n=1 Tax=Paenibacillus protaetiae TaxID=2509456 RepID=A0A4P6EQX1_9BACL|nr:glutaminase family protein [Paenibacillus protaetiae]QAY65254.1 DUF4965 domain-containing protein [Paenibacillus protaetiae]
MRKSIRPPAVPLVTVDPYFSVWSTADQLTEDFTRHWTGQRHAMTGLIRIDGETWRFAGKVEPDATRYYTEPPAMRQCGLTVTPLSTVYQFEASGVELKVRFMTPLLLDDPELLSRPASYVLFETRSLDGRKHNVQLYFDVTGEWCVDKPEQSVVWEQGAASGLSWFRMGSEKQAYLGQIGDDVRIDWGYLYFSVRNSDSAELYADGADIRKSFVRNEELNSRHPLPMPRAVSDRHPVMASVFECGDIGEEPVSRLVVLAYDDVYALEYFGEKVQGYWKRNGQTAVQMIASAFEQFGELQDRCDDFDSRLLEEGIQAGGRQYADILSLAYRQAIAAHKLVSGPKGELLFISKECYSNGCMATVDVSYPSVPLFLLYNPDLVEGMLRPILAYAGSGEWPFEFAPHDIGTYPLGNGQVYGENKLEYQMPVEECGNMLVMMAAVSKAKSSAAFAGEHWELLTKWADYLVQHGLDPENQLCTDDFAGHLARNANLSIKAIMGIASYSLLCGMLGKVEQELRYRALAKEMAGEWIKLADEGDHYRLAFGSDGTWSLKYNLIWDILFSTGIFPEEVASKEVAWYLKTQDRYGIPLDNRKHYTKADWLIWSAALAERREDFESLIEPLWNFAHETPDRVPMTDWYGTVDARWMNFQHRSVVGGFFIQILKKRWTES